LDAVSFFFFYDYISLIIQIISHKDASGS